MTLAVVEYVEGRGPLPAALGMYLKARDWGDPWGTGWMKWPARVFTEMRYVGNVYGAWSAYTRAENRVEWLNRNPGGGRIVGVVKSYLFGEEEGN